MSFKAVALCSRAGTADKCRRKVRCTYGTERFFFPYLTYSFVWSSRIPSEKICVQTKPSILSIRAIFLWPWKTVSVSVRYLFYQPVDGKIKAWTLRFLAKEKPNMRKHCSIGQSFCSMTSKRSIGWFLENSQAYNYEVFSRRVRLTNQKSRAFDKPIKSLK